MSKYPITNITVNSTNVTFVFDAGVRGYSDLIEQFPKIDTQNGPSGDPMERVYRLDDLKAAPDLVMQMCYKGFMDKPVMEQAILEIRDALKPKSLQDTRDTSYIVNPPTTAEDFYDR